MVTKKLETFRPYLTSDEILHIVSLVQGSNDRLSQSVYKKLVHFKFKISQGIVAPQYTQTRQTLTEKLGLDSPVSKSVEYQERLESTPFDILSDEEKFNLLAGKAMADTLTEKEREAGVALELKLYGFDMGTFHRSTGTNTNS